MGSSGGEGPFKKEHTYVMLDQQGDDSEPIRVIGDQAHTESVLLDHSQKGSDLSIEKPEAKLLSKSKFSDFTLKLSSALLYGTCSFLITVINKIVLTTYAFPSSNILGVGQMVAILIILKLASQFNMVTIRRVSIRNKKVLTLAAIYLCNLMSGLAGTKHLPLPMLIALRRFSIAMTALGEFYLLHVKQTFSIVMTIVAMIGGSFIAAASDLTFSSLGYTLVMISNFFTAANVVYIKKTVDSKEINKHEILFYNALYTIVPLVIICALTNDIKTLINFQHWRELGFLASFFGSCVMGYLLMFSTVLCTHHNSALTTTIVGTLKVSSIDSLQFKSDKKLSLTRYSLQNILTTYVGMYIGGDYQFSVMNFLGLNISLAGSLVYSYLTFRRKTSPKEQAVTQR